MDGYERFLQQFPIKQLEKGWVILQQDVVPTTAFVVRKGVVKTYNITAQGDEKSISFDVANEIFPAAWVFDKAPRSLFYYEAFTDCELYVVPKEAYQKYLKSNPAAAYDILDHRTNHAIGYMLRINALIQSSAHAKLLHSLHFLSLKFGKEVRRDRVTIDLPLTQQELANFIGLTRETTAIELKTLKERGIISYYNRHYSVKTDKLNELLDEEYNPGVSIND